MTISGTATAPGPMNDSAIGSADQLDPNLANNTATASATAIAPQADIQLTANASAATVVVGDAISFTLNVDDAGPQGATNVVVTDTLPANFSLSSFSFTGSPVAGSSIQNNGDGTVTLRLPSLAVGAGADTGMTISGTATAPGPMNDSAIGSADQLDPNMANNTATASATATGLSASGTAVAVSEGQIFKGQVATFTDVSPLTDPTLFTATIAWGDRVTTTGTVVLVSPGVFQVIGMHQYAEEGTMPITVNINGPGGDSAAARGAATIADAPISAVAQNVDAVEGNAAAPVVAKFHDGNPLGVASDFSAVISWGDGTATPGTVSGSLGNYTVSGNHTYADEGFHRTSIVITDDGGSSATVSGRAFVADAPLTGFAATFNAVRKNAFTGVVGSFADANLLNTSPSGFRAIIVWGDFGFSLGTIVYNSATQRFDIIGTHKYNTRATQLTVSIFVFDLGGATPLTIQSTAILSDGTPGNGTPSHRPDGWLGEA
ncbi:MAG: DUF11 domain-containing protein, partial [Tepidisphaerales bacterium]